MCTPDPRERLGRHKISGFVDATSPSFDFGQLYQLLFGYLTVSLPETTDFITQNFIEVYNSRLQQRRDAAKPKRGKLVLQTVLSTVVLGGIYLLRGQRD